MPELPNIDNLICYLNPTDIFGSWFVLAGLALLTSVMILMFLYLIATLLRSQNTITFIKLEFYEVLSTLLIISLIAGVAGSACTVKVGWFFPASQNADNTTYGTAMAYYDEVAGKFQTWMHMQYVINLYLDQMASATPYSRPLGVGLVATPLAGLASPIKSFLYNVFTAMGIAYVINEAQKYVFIFATYGFLKYYLPIGVFLRSFTPTRRIGGALIALSLSFIFLLPVMTTITAESMLGKNLVTGESYGVLIGIDNLVTKEWGDSNLGGQSAICNPDPSDPTKLICQNPGPVAGFFKSLFLPNVDFNTFISGGFITIIGGWVKSVIGGILGTLLFIPLSTAAMAFTLGYLVPALNILIFVYTTKFFSRTLGEEIDVTTLTRMI